MAITSEQFVFNSDNDNFETALHIGGTTVELGVCDFAETQKAEALVHAQRTEIWLEQNMEKLRDYIAAELLDLKNEEWIDEDETPLTKAAFKAGLTLTSVMVFEDGSFQLYLDDNNMFWGHLVLVDVNSDGSYKRATIAG
jgi:hypothetical protein